MSEAILTRTIVVASFGRRSYTRCVDAKVWLAEDISMPGE